VTQRFSEECSAELELGFAGSRRLPSRGPAFGLNQRFFEDEDEDNEDEAPRVLERPRPKRLGSPLAQFSDEQTKT
jgi:hypothetical protein